MGAKQSEPQLAVPILQFLGVRGRAFIRRGRVYGGGTIDEIADALRSPVKQVAGTVLGMNRAQVLVDSGVKRMAKTGRLSKVFYKL